jgi:hypothetical protein
MDEPEGLITPLARKPWRHRDKELINAIGGHHLAEELWPTFGQDGTKSICLEDIEDRLDVDAIAGGNTTDLRRRRKDLAKPACSTLGREDKRSRLEGAVTWIEVPPGSDDHQPRRCFAHECPAQLLVTIGRRRKDELGRPQGTPTFGPHRSGPNDDGICVCPQQPHDEAIGFVPAAYDAA